MASKTGTKPKPKPKGKPDKSKRLVDKEQHPPAAAAEVAPSEEETAPIPAAWTYDVGLEEARDWYKGEESHRDGVTGLQVVKGLLFSSSLDHTAIAWNLQTRQGLLKYEHTDWVNCLCVAGGYLFTGSEDCVLRKWDIRRATLLHEYAAFPGPVVAVVVIENVVFVAVRNVVFAVNFDTAEVLRQFVGHADDITCMVGHMPYLFSAGHDCTARRWALDTHVTTRVFQGHTEKVNALCVDDGSLYTASDDRSIRVWNLESGRCRQILLRHTDSVRSLISPRPNFLISGSWDGTICLWNLRDVKSLLITSDYVAERLTSASDGRLLAASYNGSIQSWELGKLFQRLGLG
eukprot:TRINITY_DN14338_c0_g1_i1.p1 TRINITY_DN14338_c0_g1~~TRINITY_DN14338_c0_g1_i1.p1  ORF type:complete len:347 (+),score=56.93 TRINITY_DN14338_c0_g1_i1:60-1100(+)